MAEWTYDEALAFIDAIRMTIAGKTGFKWMTEKLEGLAVFIRHTGEENERMRAFIASAGLSDEYEAAARG